MKLIFHHVKWLIVIIFSLQSLKGQQMFPENQWPIASSASLGVDSVALQHIDELMKRSKANGILIKNGYQVKSWNYDGDIDRKIESQSITKSITGLVLGLALKQGLIKNIDEPVVKYYPNFEGGPYKNEITFRNLASATSGLPVENFKTVYPDPGTQKPNFGHYYHNDHTAHLALVLTYIYAKPLDEVLEQVVLSKLKVSTQWAKGKKTVEKEGKIIPVVQGFAFSSWNPSDLAKIGWLYMHNGKWKNDQILDENYIKETFTAIPYPLYEMSKSSKLVERDKKHTYGLAWRGLRKGNQIIWYMSGNGGQMCVLFPKENMLFVKLNGHQNNYRPFTSIIDFEPFLSTLTKK